jgi:ComF family protein
MLSMRALGITRPWTALRTWLPSQCAVCHAWPSLRVCNACVARFMQPGPRCRRCALRLPEGVAVCGTCVKAAPAFDACVAALDYAYPWRDLLTAFKFRQDPGWAGPLATLLRSAPWVEHTLDNADLILPIPLSAQRLRERGFNQTLLLARHLAPHKTDSQSLLRLHDTAAQSGLSRAQRLRNLRGAFALEPRRSARLAGLHVVLLDDVMTTGATLEAATGVLRDAGVAHVTALVLARTGLD